MTTRNVVIYHCLSCGSVVHAEPEAEPPQCCGHEMVKAAAETIREGQEAEEAAPGHCETAPPIGKGRPKPR
ncbi:MAG: hypothetical protein ACM3U2_03200 [Deltaproteobacteria bacterium]